MSKEIRYEKVVEYDEETMGIFMGFVVSLFYMIVMVIINNRFFNSIITFAALIGTILAYFMAREKPYWRKTK